MAKAAKTREIFCNCKGNIIKICHQKGYNYACIAQYLYQRIYMYILCEVSNTSKWSHEPQRE